MPFETGDDCGPRLTSSEREVIRAIERDLTALRLVPEPGCDVRLMARTAALVMVVLAGAAVTSVVGWPAWETLAWLGFLVGSLVASGPIVRLCDRVMPQRLRKVGWRCSLKASHLGSRAWNLAGRLTRHLRPSRTATGHRSWAWESRRSP